MTRFATKT